jgi:hypothetical protein
MKPSERNPVAEKTVAEAREREAKAKLDQAKVEVKATKAELDALSGVTAAKERVKKGVADAKQFAAADLAQTKADFKYAHDRLAAWDAATTRDLDARLDTVDAQLAVWKAEANVKRAEQEIKRHDDFATLEEKIALARARASEAKHEKYTVKAQAALGEAVEAFEQAYGAAARRYNPGM